ncbi:MAG: pirin family protein [Planctomycetota bacterium]
MIRRRPAGERGQRDFGWLHARHSFSFGDYFDPAHMGFRSLRVLNEDTVQPGTGFGTHGHDNMEIISYIVSGVIAHEDSMGSRSELRPGDVQVMSAGTGITHSEFNGSSDEPLHLLQIWIVPDRRGRTPRYDERHFSEDDRRGRLLQVVGPESAGAGDRLTIGQDASIYAGLLDGGQSLTHVLAPGRHAWVQLVRGALSLGDVELHAGDGAAVSNEGSLALRATEASEVLVLDLA